MPLDKKAPEPEWYEIVGETKIPDWLQPPPTGMWQCPEGFQPFWKNHVLDFQQSIGDKPTCISTNTNRTGSE